MLFWIRELAGWCLVLVALWVLSVALKYSTTRQVVEAGVVGFIGLGVLRAGILLVRISTAARIAQRDLKAVAPPTENVKR
jgi:hypothetical protein